MIKNKFLVSIMLLLLLTLHSCSVEELENSSNPKLDIATKNVNPQFLKVNLSAYKIKPIWTSVISFEDKNTIEVNFYQDNKISIPRMVNSKIDGRKRLLLMLKDGIISQSIVQYLPSNIFIGDVKKVNTQNLKQMMFDGMVLLTNLVDNTTTMWNFENGKIIGKATSKKSKNKAFSKFVPYEYEICSLHWYCVSDPFTHEIEYCSDPWLECKSYTGERWEEDEPIDPTDPTDPTDPQPDPNNGDGGEGIITNNSNQTNFKFPAGSDYQRQFPKFSSLIQNISDYVNSNSKVLQTLLDFTGLTKSELLAKLKFGAGPTVVIEYLPGLYGYHNPFTNTVKVNQEYIDKLEQSQGASGELLNLLLSITLLHEFVHWQDGLIFDYTQENGENWEKATYGFIVTNGNVGLIKK